MSPHSTPTQHTPVKTGSRFYVQLNYCFPGERVATTESHCESSPHTLSRRQRQARASPRADRVRARLFSEESREHRNRRYMGNAAANDLRSAGLNDSLHNVHKYMKAGIKSTETEKELKSTKRRLAIVTEQRDSLRAKKKTRTAEVQTLKKALRRLGQRFSSESEKWAAMAEYYQSPEFEKKTANEYIVRQIRDPNGTYTGTFKHLWSHFAQKCASLSAAKAAGQTLFSAVGLDDIKLPARSTTTTFKIVEGEAEVLSWLKGGITLFGLNCDGSKRGDRDLFEVILYGWNHISHRPEWRLVVMIDLGGSSSSQSMARALLWSVENHLGLDHRDWVVQLVTTLIPCLVRVLASPEKEAVLFLIVDAPRISLLGTTTVLEVISVGFFSSPL